MENRKRYLSTENLARTYREKCYHSGSLLSFRSYNTRTFRYMLSRKTQIIGNSGLLDYAYKPPYIHQSISLLAASTASESAISFPLTQECALTFLTSKYFPERSASTICHRRRFLIYFLSALRQPSLLKSSSQRLKPFMQHSLSE